MNILGLISQLIGIKTLRLTTLITKWLITPIKREEQISSRERRTEMEVRETNQREKGALGFFGGWIGS